MSRQSDVRNRRHIVLQVRESFSADLICARAEEIFTEYKFRARGRRLRVSPYSASIMGVATPTRAAISRTAPTSASSSIGREASTSCSMEVLNAPSLRVTSWRSSGDSVTAQPMRSPTARPRAWPLH